MDTHSLLNVILAEIASEEKSLAKKRLVAEFLQDRLAVEGDGSTHSSSSLGELRMPQHAGGGVDDFDLQESFSESVAKAVQELNNREFTASDVHAALVRKGVKFKSSTPKASISTALSRLVDTDVLRLAYKGAGKTPNRFVRATTPTEEDLRREEKR